MKTFEMIEFNGHGTIKLHGVSPFGYDQIYDIECILVESRQIFVSGVPYRLHEQSERQTKEEVVAVLARIIYAGRRFIPATQSFRAIMEKHL